MDERKSFISSRPAVETKPPPAMDYRTVLIPLCVLFTQAPCRPAGSREAEETIDLALKEIGILWGHLDDSLPNFSCSLNVTEVGLKQRPLSALRLSNVRCYVQKLSNAIIETEEMLRKVAQFINDVESKLSNSTTPQSCSIPDRPEVFKFAKCFLELVLEERPTVDSLMKS